MCKETDASIAASKAEACVVTLHSSSARMQTLMHRHVHKHMNANASTDQHALAHTHIHTYSHTYSSFQVVDPEAARITHQRRAAIRHAARALALALHAVPAGDLQGAGQVQPDPRGPCIHCPGRRVDLCCGSGVDATPRFSEL